MAVFEASSLAFGVWLLAGLPPRRWQPDQDSRQADRKAIEEVVGRFVEAWNRHDARAFAMVFTEDCDFTNVAGASVHGREQTEAMHARTFATVFKASRQTAEIRSVRFLSPELAAVDVEWHMSGARTPEGKIQPDRRGLLGWIMARQPDGSWLIEVMHNTDLTAYEKP